MSARLYPAADKLKAVDREIGFRQHVYPRRVADGRMTQTLADEQIGVMQAIREDYQLAADIERQASDLFGARAS